MRAGVPLAIVVVLTAACGGGGGDDPGGLPAEPFALGLDEGECFDRLESPDVTEVPSVPCDQAHDLEVIAVVALPEGDFPGDDQVVTAATTVCQEEFEGYVGRPSQDSGLLVVPLPPSRAQWDGGDRSVVCAAGLVDGQLEESVRDSEAPPAAGQ